MLSKEMNFSQKEFEKIAACRKFKNILGLLLNVKLSLKNFLKVAFDKAKTLHSVKHCVHGAFPLSFKIDY